MISPSFHYSHLDTASLCNERADTITHPEGQFVWPRIDVFAHNGKQIAVVGRMRRYHNLPVIVAIPKIISGKILCGKAY